MNIILRPLLLCVLFSFAFLSSGQAEKTKSLSSRIRLYEEKSKAYDAYIEEQLKELKKIKQNFYLNHVIGTKRTDERRKTISAEMELIGLIENYMKAKRDVLKAITKCIPYDKDADISDDTAFFGKVKIFTFGDTTPFIYDDEFKVLFDLLRKRLGKFSPDGFICRFGELPPRERLAAKLKDFKKASNEMLPSAKPIYLFSAFDDSVFYMAKLKYMAMDRYGAAFLPPNEYAYGLLMETLAVSTGLLTGDIMNNIETSAAKDFRVAAMNYLISYEELVPVLCNYVEWR